jgi:nucleoside-diphosphate-sugar epimerase
MTASIHPRVLVTGAGGFIGRHLLASRGIDHVYALAADMGGMGFISANHATILRNNALITIHTLEAARMNGASRYLFSSSACVYPEHLQVAADVAPDYPEPLNLGSEEMMTVTELARIIVEVSGKEGITLRHVDGPQGVRGRSSDNRRLHEVLGWEPSVTLHQGPEPTYRWIEKQVTSRRPPWAAAGR